jgi:hypothetical protein
MFQAMTKMTDTGNGRHTQNFLAAPLLLLLAPVAFAQYPGHIKPEEQKKPDEPRAVSILEWVGAPGKPVAGRIVPLSVFVNGQYQDGGLFMAQPAPITVENDTLYELQLAGIPKGTFYVAGGQEVEGAWFGYGKWKPLTPPAPPKKLQPSKVPPKVIQDNDPDRPHLKNSSPASGSGSSGGSGSANTSAAPDNDPDKPTLHRSPNSSGSGQGNSQSTTTPSSGGGGTAGSTSSTSTTSSNDPDQPTLHRRTDADNAQAASGAGTGAEDPDRPHLRKQSAAAAAADSGDGSPVSSVNEGDPDRPRLSHGKPVATEAPLQATKLTGVPPDLQQMAAISDPVNREEHPYSYPWPDPSEATRMQAAIEQLAIKAALSGGIAPSALIGPTATPAKPAKTTTTKSASTRKAQPQQPQAVLSDKDFHAYELSYNGGATLVFTAKATLGPDKSGATQEKYVTIIAQPDFNGDPQLRLQSVTDPKHLDITPRMKLVDAVDTNGDGRAELIFELMRASDRQFAIYVIRGLQAQQAFATEALPYVAAGHAVETSSN